MKSEQSLYCVVAPDGLFCWWSLGPTEEDSWRFFGEGCVDKEPIKRAQGEGLRCVRVKLTVEDDQ